MTPPDTDSGTLLAEDAHRARLVLSVQAAKLSASCRVLVAGHDATRREPGALVATAATLAGHAEHVLTLAVIAERMAGASWQNIGDVLGITRQSAWTRFAGAAETFEQRRPRLVPDNEDLVELVRRALDVLEHVEAYTQDTAPDAEPWVVPAPLADSVALQALCRVAHVLEQAVGSFRDADQPPGPRIFGPDGRDEHVAFRAVIVNRADLDTLAEALTVATVALSPAERAAEEDPAARDRLANLAKILDEFSPGGFRASWDGGRPLDSPDDTLLPLTRLLALFALPDDDDTVRIVERLASAGGADVRLTASQELAYHRLADRLNRIITGGDPLSRFMY
ncbi:hypothetical protein [Actinophytocola sp.]|uniref:hypothetical protein n=1 Tax=Actinophytocola sp. TaxID=1872138 RepID=UPI002ED13EF0